MDNYNLQDDVVMIGLWNDQASWILAYYKDIFCSQMTSTERSERMNHILKKGFVKERHNLHLFVDQVDHCIHTQRGVKHAEMIANEVLFLY